MLVERRRRGHSTPVSGSTTATSLPGAGRPSAPGLRVADRRDDDRALARSVAADERDAEPLAERGRVGRRRLGRERELHAVVAVVGRRRRREHVRQRAPDGVEVRRVEAPDVGEERRRRELAPQRDRRAGRQRGHEVRRERVAVEQRHRAVQDVVGRERHRARRSARTGPACRAPPWARPSIPT